MPRRVDDHDAAQQEIHSASAHEDEETRESDDAPSPPARSKRARLPDGAYAEMAIFSRMLGEDNSARFTRKVDLQNEVLPTSKFRGVSWKERDNRWRAEIWVNGKRNHLGYFTSEVDAARAYNAAVRRFNLPEERLNSDIPNDMNAKSDFKLKKATSRYKGVSWQRLLTGGSQMYG